MTRILLLLTLLCCAIFGTATAHAEESIPAAYQLTVMDAEAAAAQALADKGAGERIRATLAGGKKASYHESSTPLKADIASLQFDKQSRRWSASLLVMSGETVIKALPISGRYDEMVTLPVLKRQVRSGEIIRDVDVDMMDIPLTRSRSDFITAGGDMIGQSPRGTIAAGRPVRSLEIAAPTLVKKNSLVTLLYQSGPLEITISGQALADGGKGEIVAVRNMTSKTVLNAVVEDARTVRIPSPANRELAGDPHHAAF